MWALCFSAAIRGEDALCLLSGDGAPYTVALEGFRAAARTMTFAIYRTPAEYAELPPLLAKHAPKLVFAVGSQAALKAAEGSEQVPVIYALVAEPAASQLAQKKGCYGVSLEAPAALEFETIRQAFPEWKKIGVIRRQSFDPGRHARLCAAANAAGVSLATFAVQEVGELNLALKRAVRESDCLLLFPDGELFTSMSLQAVLRFSVANNFPVIGYSPQLSRAGAPLAVYVSASSAGRYASVVAERALAGRCAACGAELNARAACRCEHKNVGFADEVSYSLNLRACRHFRLSVSDDVLRKVDEVFGKEEK